MRGLLLTHAEQLPLRRLRQYAGPTRLVAGSQQLEAPAHSSKLLSPRG